MSTVLIIGLCFCLVLGVIWIAGLKYGRWRAEDYRRQKVLEYEPDNSDELSEEGVGSKFESYYAALGKVSRPYHKKAVSTQSAYQHTLAAMSSLTFLALVTLGFSLSFPNHHLKEFFNIFELIALCSIAVLFYMSRKHNAEWIMDRITSELVRTMRVLTSVSLATDDEFDLHRAKENFLEDVKKVVDEVGSKSCKKSSEGFAVEVGEKIIGSFSSTVSHQRLLMQDLESYRRRRLLKQRNWFGASADRLLKSLGRSERLLLGMFIATLLLALGKVLHYYQNNGDYAPVLGLMLMVLAATTAAIMYHLSGQGSYSLLQLYCNQRDVAGRYSEMITPMIERLRDTANDQAVELTLENSVDVIKSFELSMIYELKDWVEITRRNSVGLG